MEAAGRPPILDYLSVLSDATRCRLLLALGRHELTVSELCAVLRLPQSTVSRHLRILGDGGWLRSRPEGVRRLYSLVPDDLDPAAERLWQLAREQFRRTSVAAEDARQLEAVLARRRARSREFFRTAAGQWDRMRDELFGRHVESFCLLGLLRDDWVVGDLGCGTGPVAGAVAPFVRRVFAVDGSTAMLDAARERLSGFDNVELCHGELEALPLEDGTLDAATLILVLHHLPDPAAVLGEVARVLKPSGRLLIVDMVSHERHEYQEEMGHVWLGFSEEQIRRFLSAAGLSPGGFRRLSAHPDARGPRLFAATAVRTGRRRRARPGRNHASSKRERRIG